MLSDDLKYLEISKWAVSCIGSEMHRGGFLILHRELAVGFGSSSTFFPAEKNAIIALHILNCILKTRQVHG